MNKRLYVICVKVNKTHSGGFWTRFVKFPLSSQIGLTPPEWITSFFSLPCHFQKWMTMILHSFLSFCSFCQYLSPNYPGSVRLVRSLLGRLQAVSHCLLYSIWPMCVTFSKPSFFLYWFYKFLVLSLTVLLLLVSLKLWRCLHSPCMLYSAAFFSTACLCLTSPFHPWGNCSVFTAMF